MGWDGMGDGMQGMSEAYAAKDDEKLKDHGEVLVNLVRVQPFFLRPQLKSIITSIVQVVACKQLDDGAASNHLAPLRAPLLLRSLLSALNQTYGVVWCVDTRRVALEFLLTLMEKGKGMVRKVKVQTIQRFVCLSLCFLSLNSIACDVMQTFRLSVGVSNACDSARFATAA